MAPRRAVKKKEHEKLSDSNILNVIELLEASIPITKKSACEILNIAYNTKRLSTIIDNWKEQQRLTKERKAAKKGKPLSKAERIIIIESYLEGEAVIETAKRIYRSVGFVKNVINLIGIPERATGDEKFIVGIIPEQCIAEDFEEGETAWSAVYHSPCLIRKKLDDTYNKKYSTNCYQIYISETIDEISPYFPHVLAGGFNAFTAAYDLGKLSHLKEYGVSI